MFTQLEEDSEIASFKDDPIDTIEPMEKKENEYREASLRMTAFMFAAFNFIHEARNQNEMAIRFWAVSSAIEHPAIDGRSDSDIARMLGTTRANFSNRIITFEKQNALPPTMIQKSMKARESYSSARKKQLITT